LVDHEIQTIYDDFVASVAVEHHSILEYYTQQSPITDPGHYAPLFHDLPHDITSLTRVVQGLLVHPSATGLYGELPERGNPAWGYRTMAETLEHIAALDSSPLTAVRVPARRLRANCRNFAVLLVAMVRHRGIPARKRVGFAAYLPGPFSYSHEIAEYWNGKDGRWVLADPQMDDVCCWASRMYFEQRGEPDRMAFHPLDIRPDDPFDLAGETWRSCRAGATDPDCFRASDTVRGLPEIRYQLLMDLAALNRAEVRSSDAWLELMTKPQADVTPEEMALLDCIAELTVQPDAHFTALGEVYADMADGRSVQSKVRVLGPN
jgi:excinuclease ABC subunit A